MMVARVREHKAEGNPNSWAGVPYGSNTQVKTPGGYRAAPIRGVGSSSPDPKHPICDPDTPATRTTYPARCVGVRTRITWIGEFFSSPVSRVSPRFVPKVASPSRSTFCIAPA
jgi:hypothetical protein